MDGYLFTSKWASEQTPTEQQIHIQTEIWGNSSNLKKSFQFCADLRSDLMLFLELKWVIQKELMPYLHITFNASPIPE